MQPLTGPDFDMRRWSSDQLLCWVETLQLHNDVEEVFRRLGFEGNEFYTLTTPQLQELFGASATILDEERQLMAELAAAPGFESGADDEAWLHQLQQKLNAQNGDNATAAALDDFFHGIAAAEAIVPDSELSDAADE